MVHIVCVTGHGSALGCSGASDALSLEVVEHTVQPTVKTTGMKTKIQRKLTALSTFHIFIFVLPIELILKNRTGCFFIFFNILYTLVFVPK